jgi:hypothetical protein
MGSITLLMYRFVAHPLASAAPHSTIVITTIGIFHTATIGSQKQSQVPVQQSSLSVDLTAGLDWRAGTSFR